jgi:hypothetical protein
VAKPTDGLIGFQGPLKQNEAVGAKPTPAVTPNPNLESGTSGNWLAGAGNVINNTPGPGPVSYLHIGQGLESPDVVNYHNYQLGQKINAITTQVPALKSHPGIVYAIATNQDMPIDPNLIASIVAARGVLGTLGKYTPEQYRKDQAAIAAQDAAAHPDNIHRALGWVGSGLDSTIGLFIRSSDPQQLENFTPGGPQLGGFSDYFAGISQGLSQIGDFAKVAINSLGTGAATAPGNEIAAIDPNEPNFLKPVANFVQTQFDMPQQMYRTYETVKEQHGSAAAILTLVPAVIGAIVGFALTGAAGGEGTAVGAEVGASIAARLIGGATEEAIAAGAADVTASTISEMEMGAIMRAVTGRLALLDRFGAPTAGTISKFVVQPVARALSSGTLLGANVGANIGGQMLFRQDFMDARDGTAWAKAHPNLAPTLGQALFGRHTVLSGITDFIAAVAAPDMIGGIGKLARDAKSVEGMKGVLGGKFKPGEMAPRELKLWKMRVPDINAWFGRQYDAKIGRYWTGTAMDNVYRAYDETGGVRNAINLIASMTSASQVMDMDQRLVPIAHRLVEAAKYAREKHPGDEMNAAVEAVKKVFSRAAAANELATTGQLPFVGSKLYDTMVHQLSESRVTNPKNLFSSLPRYIDIEKHKINIHDFALGDKNSVPAIRDLVRLMTGDEDYARSVADILLATDDPGTWNNVYFGLHAGLIQVEAVMALTGKTVSADISKLFMRVMSDKIDTDLRKLLNVGGPGGASRFGYGTVLHEDGKAVSSKDLTLIEKSIEKAKDAIDVTGAKGVHTTFPDAEDPLLGEHPLSEVSDDAGSTTTAAITLAETARLRLPNLQELNKNMRLAVDYVLKHSDKIKADVVEQVDEMNAELDKLAERIDKAKSEEYKAKLVEQHAKLSFQKDELEILGYSIKPDASLKYEQLKNGIAVTGSSTHDFLDKVINTFIFKPLALLTGGWATRTGTSEVISNIFRQGPLNYVAGQAARQVARHERAILAVGKPLTAPRARDIAARIDKVVEDMNLPTFEGKAFESEEEAQNFIAALHDATAKIDLMQAHFSGDFASETAAGRAAERRAASEVSMSSKELNKAIGKARRHATKAYGWQLAIKMVNKQELMDAAIRLMYLNNGHILDPMLSAIHTGVAHDISIESPEEFNIMAARMSLFGLHSNKPKIQRARLGSEFRDYNPLDGTIRFQYPAVRQRRALWLMADKQRLPVIQTYAMAYQQALNDGLKGVDAIHVAREVAHAKAMEVLDGMTDSEKAFMMRQRRQLEQTSPFAARNNKKLAPLGLDPEEKAKFDHASALLYTTESIWLGPNGYFQKELLGDMANGTVPKFGELKEFYERYHLNAKGGDEWGNFSVLPGPEVDHVSGALRTLANAPSAFASKVHGKILGPIVNNMSRNPMMIIEFAAQRKLLEKKVLEKSLSSDQADALAQTRALVNSIKYIHNPADKLKFENMIRLFAPFYFAENQAWRRLGRLAMSDPGAAEQYVKFMYLTQDAIYNYDQQHNTTGIPIPGSAWLTKELTGLWGSSIAVPLMASTASLKTIMPWSAESGKPPGIDSLLSSLMPKGGLATSLPAAMYLEYANDTPVYDPRVANFLGKYVLGDQGIGQPLLLQLIPNSIMGNVIKGIWGAAAAATRTDPISGNYMTGFSADVTAPYITVYNHVLAENINQMQESIWNKHKNDMPGSSWSGTAEQYRVAMMLSEISKELDPKTPGGKYQELLDRTNMQTATLWTLKTLISAGSPMSTMLDRADAQYNTKFQDLINSEGSITKAFDKYTQMYPWATASTIFTSKSTQGVAYPETDTAAQWLLHNGSVVDRYKAGARYLIPEGALLKGKQPYSQFAHFIESSWALRQQQSPAGFMNSYLDSVFNQYYYGILNKVAAHYVNTGQISASQAYSWLTNPNAKERDPSTWRALETFGYKYAPTALGDHQQGHTPVRDKVFSDLQSMVSDPTLRQQYPILNDMKDQLFDKALPWLNAAEQSNSWKRADLAKAWNDNLDTLETEQNGRYAALIPVIEGVFRPMKPMFLY